MDYEALLLIPGPFVAVVLCALFFWMCSKHVENAAPRIVLPVAAGSDSFASDELMAKKRAALFSYRVVMNPSGSFFLGAARVGSSVESSASSQISKVSRPKHEADGENEPHNASENVEDDPPRVEPEAVVQVLESVVVVGNDHEASSHEGVI